MLGGESLHAVEMVFLLLLVFVAVFAVVARWLKVAYPIVLLVAGLLVSFLPHVPKIPLNPELVFLIFLPPLLYSSAWNTSWREFRYNSVTIGLLAVGLVAFTVWGVAEFSDRFVAAMDWKAGFLLGAVVAATDAIAATSIARSLGLPRRIVDILEGESLLNDATGLLALEFGLRLLMRGDTPGLGEGLLRLLYLTFVGAGVGLAMGFVVSKVSRLVDDGPVEMVVSLVLPYAAYLAGDAVKASGVFAVVACGLYMSRQSSTMYSPRVRMQAYGIWDALTFVLNGLVFILIGLQLPFVLAAIRGAYSWGDAREVRGGVQRGADRAAACVGLSSVGGGMVVAEQVVEAERPEAAVQGSVCGGVDWDAGCAGAGGGDLSAGDAGGWAAVCGAESDSVSGVFGDSGDAGIAGVDAASADPMAWAVTDWGGGRGGEESTLYGAGWCDRVSRGGQGAGWGDVRACLRGFAAPVSTPAGRAWWGDGG